MFCCAHIKVFICIALYYEQITSNAFRYMVCVQGIAYNYHLSTLLLCTFVCFLHSLCRLPPRKKSSHIWLAITLTLHFWSNFDNFWQPKDYLFFHMFSATFREKKLPVMWYVIWTAVHMRQWSIFTGTLHITIKRISMQPFVNFLCTLVTYLV